MTNLYIQKSNSLKKFIQKVRYNSTQVGNKKHREKVVGNNL